MPPPATPDQPDGPGDDTSPHSPARWRVTGRQLRRPAPIAVLIAAIVALVVIVSRGDGPNRDAVVLPAGFELKDSKQFGLENLERIETPDGIAGPTIRVHYPAGSASQTVTKNEGAPVGGVQYLARSPKRLGDVVHLRYWVRFAPNFDFVRGGKLPGLYGGSRFSGRQIPDGTDGLSTRYMWRTGGAGEVYAYLPSSVDAGTSLGRGSWTFPRDEWVMLEQEVVLNRPGDADGSITVWVDEERVAHFEGIEFRTTGDLRIDGVFVSTFFGGDDPSWAPTKPMWAEFSGFAVSDRYIGSGDG